VTQYNKQYRFFAELAYSRLSEKSYFTINFLFLCQ